MYFAQFVLIRPLLELGINPRLVLKEAVTNPGTERFQFTFPNEAIPKAFSLSSLMFSCSFTKKNIKISILYYITIPSAGVQLDFLKYTVCNGAENTPGSNSVPL